MGLVGCVPAGFGAAGLVGAAFGFGAAGFVGGLALVGFFCPV